MSTQEVADVVVTSFRPRPDTSIYDAGPRSGRSGQTLRRNPQDVRIFLEALNVIREDNVDFAQLPAGLTNALHTCTDLLTAHRYLDYSRMVLDAPTALHDDHPTRVQLQETLRHRIKYVVVDEYQDVNPLQEGLIRRLHELGANLCVVGDDDQTIYQWRGSEIDNILDFLKRYPSVRSVTLADNFRSSRGVVAAGKLVAENNNPDRLPKDMNAAGHQPFERGDLLALTFNSPDEEAQWIAHKILDLRGVPFQDEPESALRGLSWADCAILLRSVKSSGGAVTQALRAAGIPYVIGGLTNLFDTPEVGAAADCSTLVEAPRKRRLEPVSVVRVYVETFPHSRPRNVGEPLMDERRRLAALSVNHNAISRGALGGVARDGVSVVQVFVLATNRSGLPRIGSDVDVPRRVDTFDFSELPIR